MKFFLKSARPREGRKFSLAAAGGWYTALTCLLGVAAVNTGNNVLYLLTSFLLGGMCLSGFLSELAIRSVTLHWRREEASAKSPLKERVEVENKSYLPLLCAEIGEWIHGKWHPLHFIPYQPPRSRVETEIQRTFERRGIWNWDGIAISTRYPFGLTRKIRWISLPGSRVIWPARPPKKDQDTTESSNQKPKLSGAGERIEGEVRALHPGEDEREIVWTLSERREVPIARVRADANTKYTDVFVDSRVDPGLEFENTLSLVSETLRSTERHSYCKLFIQKFSGREIVLGRENALNTLALLQAEGKRASS